MKTVTQKVFGFLYKTCLVIRVLEIVLPSPRFRNIKMASYLMEKPLILKI